MHSNRGGIADIDEDADITLVDEVEGRKDDLMFGIDDLAGNEVVVESKAASKDVNLNKDEVTLAQTLQKLKNTTPKAKWVVIREREQGDTLRTVIPEQKIMDKGKGKMVEIEKPMKLSRKDQILPQQQEQEELTNKEKEKLFVELLEARKKHYAAKRVEEKRRKPPTKAQKRKTMSTYLKNMAGWKLHQLKNKSYDEVQELFDQAMVRVNAFVDIDLDMLECTSKRAGSELEKEAKKKQKTDDGDEIAKLQMLVEITPDEEEVVVDAIPLALKPLVIGRIVEIQRLLDVVQDVAAQDQMFGVSVVSRKVTTAKELKLLQEIRVLQDKVVEEITAGWDIEIKKLEIEIWNLKVKGTDVVSYNLMLLRVGKCDICSPRPFARSHFELANDLNDKSYITFNERHAKNKRKLKNSNQAQQQLPKRQNVAQTYTIRSGEKKEIMPPKKTTAAPMSTADIEQLIETRVAESLANHETQRNSNGYGSYNSGTRTGRVVCTPRKFGHDTTYGMPWKTLMKKITNKYCLRSEIKKLEIEIWNLKVKGKCDICKSKTMQDPIELANDLMDQKLYTFTERHAKNKRKLENSNQAQQQLPKRQNVAQTYTIRSGEKKEYARTLLLCNKCEFHYNGPCTVKSDCPELKNQNHGNQDGGTEARGMVYVLGGGETNQDIDNMEDDINA
ncbi:hypothetical protein Tco_1210086 [Tanacetum coccineum]